jgi:cation-transporting P-type ATPase 13A2
LYFPEIFPNSKITAFSNSRTQKRYIDENAKEKGLKNLTVITGNVVDYEFEKESFDRVVSIEVGHMTNARGLTNIPLALRAHEKL